MSENFWFGILQKINDLGDLGIGREIILKWILSRVRHTRA
jgi:hypothetical protein